MSIASELTNLESNIGDAYDAVNDMSGIIPQHKNMANLDQAIRTIPQSAGTTYTAGNGINIDANNEISIDDTVVAELSDLPGVMTGATSGTAGTSGLVPAPTAGDESKILRGDGTWAAQNEPIVVWLDWDSVGTDLEILGTVTAQFMDNYTSSATAVGSSFFAGAVSDNKQVIIRTGGGLPVPGTDWATETVRPVQVKYDGMGSATMYFWHETMFVRAQCPDSGTTWTFTKLSV